MTKGNNNKKKFQVKSFNHKWYEFLIIYGIFNIFFFFSINSVINGICENFSKLYVSKVTVDGSDFSILVNLFATPLFMILVVIGIGFFLLQEFIVMLLFNFVYFKSMVKDEEKIRLYQYTKITLFYFLLANIIGIMFWGDIKRTIFFVFLYLTVPLFTLVFICLKIKKCIKEG